MTKPLYNITARSIIKDIDVDLEFESIGEAARKNPGLTEFELKSIIHK